MVNVNGLEVVNKNGQLSVKTTNTYYEAFQKLLSAGAYTKLKEMSSKGISSSDRVIDKFSPNNVRRVIVGLDGIFVQFYVGTSQFMNKHQFTPVQINEKLVFELVDPSTKSTPVLKVLHGDRKTVMGERVFSSIEEIIVLNATPNFNGTFNNSGIEWFNENETAKKSFKRLRAVVRVLTPITVADFIEQHKEYLDNPLRLLTPDIKLDKQVLVVAGSDYLTKTSLRPQYYSMDEVDSPLWKYFDKTKTAYLDKLAEEGKKKRASSSEIGSESGSSLGLSRGQLTAMLDFTESLIDGVVSYIPDEVVRSNDSAINEVNRVSNFWVSRAKEKSWNTSGSYNGVAVGSSLERFAFMVYILRLNEGIFEDVDWVQLKSSLSALAFICYGFIESKEVDTKPAYRFAKSFSKFADNDDNLIKSVLGYGQSTLGILESLSSDESHEGEVDLEYEEEVVAQVEGQVAEELSVDVDFALESEGEDFPVLTAQEWLSPLVSLYEEGKVRPTMEALYEHLVVWSRSSDSVSVDGVLGSLTDFLKRNRQYQPTFSLVYSKHGIAFIGSSDSYDCLGVMFGGSSDLTLESLMGSLLGIFKHDVPSKMRDMQVLFDKAELLARGVADE